MLIIGSVAAKFWIPSFRDSNDIDVWMLPHEFASWYDQSLNNITSFKPERMLDKYFAKLNVDGKILSMEIRILSEQSSQMAMLKSQRHDYYVETAGGRFQVASLKTLIKLKRSHLEFPLRWAKHIEDYANLLEQYATDTMKYDSHQDNELLDAAYKQLYKATATRLGAKTANLNMSNEDFFAKSAAKVHRVYDHDSIHRAVMFYDQPMFEKIKDDLSKASCSKLLWEKLSYEDKIRTVQEEAMVIALERRVLPKFLSGESFDIDTAFAWALQRICTNLTSGWFRNFAIDNWRNCSKLGFNYFDKLDKNRLVIND